MTTDLWVCVFRINVLPEDNHHAHTHPQIDTQTHTNTYVTHGASPHTCEYTQLDTCTHFHTHTHKHIHILPLHLAARPFSFHHPSPSVPTALPQSRPLSLGSLWALTCPAGSMNVNAQRREPGDWRSRSEEHTSELQSR